MELMYCRNNRLRNKQMVMKYKKELRFVSYLDDSFLVSTGKVLGLPLSLLPIPHHLDMEPHTQTHLGLVSSWHTFGHLDQAKSLAPTSIPGTSFLGVWPPGFPWPSGSQGVRFPPPETRGTGLRRLEDWGPRWALEEIEESGIKTQSTQGS